jgi:phosphonoacetaldehyde hydrolase
MCYLNAVRMAAGPLWTLVKIGDTPSDVAEGLNAGMWTIGVTRTGNEVGMTASEWEAATAPEKQTALAVAERRLREAGAHFVAESVAGCINIIEEIETRLGAGARP